MTPYRFTMYILLSIIASVTLGIGVSAHYGPAAIVAGALFTVCQLVLVLPLYDAVHRAAKGREPFSVRSMFTLN